jgi:(1->4)-alpha-D-glucan 1-alpha-D-glucosylmutase
VSSSPRPLTATYRLQLGPNLDLAGAASLIPYLERLGVSHLYVSPLLQAAPGSTHGYDVVDHGLVSAELGGEAGRTRLVETLRERGMGLVLDIVPNHMAIAGRHNRWWWDVLENGASSRYALAFDIAWEPPDGQQRGQILVPLLGDHYGRVLERGEFRLIRDGGAIILRYWEHECPIAVDTLASPLREAAVATGSAEMAELAEACQALPERHLAPDAERRARHEQKEAILQRLAALCAAQPEVCAVVDGELRAIEQDAERLDALISAQHFRLARWQTAQSELDYRRFFDVQTLVGLRMEEEDVFRESHDLILSWLRDGSVQGLRIDHVDGLHDPEGYLRRLSLEAPGAWVVVEKILADGERLPSRWPVAGTTGYDFAAMALGLFVDPAGEKDLTAIWEELTGDTVPWPDVSHQSRHHVMLELLASDLARLAGGFSRVCERNRRFRDFTRIEVLEALREILACMPVYRSYVRPEAQELSDADRHWLSVAVARARERRPDFDGELFDFIQSVLQLQHRGEAETDFVARFQQTSGAVMGKGVEDTAFYRYLRLAGLNEVGGDPGRFGVEPEEFHRDCQARAEEWPEAMIGLSTHDSKRSADVRCRLAVLSEAPRRWADAVRAWSAHNERHRSGPWPDPAFEYLLYQTLVGAWPIEPDRLRGYLEKAMREAKVHTSWLQPSEEYERAALEFTDRCLGDAAFRSELETLIEELSPAARATSLSLLLLTLTAPGVPDVYQGSELWDNRLVDPDNRGPVDFGRRRDLLEEIDHLTAEDCWKRAAEGLPKMLLLTRGLRLRSEEPDAFRGRYRPLEVRGERADHLIAYERGERVVALAPRLCHGLGAWQDTTVEIEEGSWRDVLGGGTVGGGRMRLADLLSGFPVGLLRRE